VVDQHRQAVNGRVQFGAVNAAESIRRGAILQLCMQSADAISAVEGAGRRSSKEKRTFAI
jgi:hypothetical protein